MAMRCWSFVAALNLILVVAQTAALDDNLAEDWLQLQAHYPTPVIR